MSDLVHDFLVTALCSAAFYWALAYFFFYVGLSLSFCFPGSLCWILERILVVVMSEPIEGFSPLIEQ